MSILAKRKSTSFAGLQSVTAVSKGFGRRNRSLSEPKNLVLVKEGDFAQDISKKKFLFYPVKYGLYSMAEELLKAGCTQNETDPNGNYPIHLAVDQSDVEMVKLLAKYGADLQVRNNSGESPMMRAVLFDDVTMVQTLHEAGASIKERNIVGQSVFDVALKDVRKRVCIYLMEQGCEARTVQKYCELHLKTSKRSSHTTSSKFFTNVFSHDKKRNESLFKSGQTNADRRRVSDCGVGSTKKCTILKRIFSRDKIENCNELDIEDHELPTFKLLEISR